MTAEPTKELLRAVPDQQATNDEPENQQDNIHARVLPGYRQIAIDAPATCCGGSGRHWATPAAIRRAVQATAAASRSSCVASGPRRRPSFMSNVRRSSTPARVFFVVVSGAPAIAANVSSGWTSYSGVA